MLLSYLYKICKSITYREKKEEYVGVNSFLQAFLHWLQDRMLFRSFPAKVTNGGAAKGMPLNMKNFLYTFSYLRQPKHLFHIALNTYAFTDRLIFNDLRFNKIV